MKKRIFALIMAVLVMLSSSGCGSGKMFDKTYENITQHPGIVPDPVDIFAEVSNYAQMRKACVQMIREYVQFGTLRIVDYKGDIESDVEEVCEAIKSASSIGMYAIYDMDGRIIRKAEGEQVVEIDIEFSKSIAMLKSMHDVTSVEEIKDLLRECIHENAPYMAFITRLKNIDQEAITRMITELYYQDASLSVFAPVSTTAAYNGFDDEKVFEIIFARPYSANELEKMRNDLLNAAQAYSPEEGQEPDLWAVRTAEEMGRKIVYEREAETYDATDIRYTAYNALLKGKATSEGMAMAYKLVCEQNGVKCEIVKGTRNNKDHCWNIVDFGGDRYHVDISEVENLGAAKTIFRNDYDFITTAYRWDTAAHKNCFGSKIYRDFLEETK